MKVLYANHTGQVSGAERSLLDLLNGLPEEVMPMLACPSGKLAQAAEQLGVPVMPIAELDASLRLHPWHTPRALLQLAHMAFRLRALAGRTKADLIHANTIRAGLSAILASKLGGPPAAIHLRDCLPSDGLAANLSRKLLTSGATLIANSEYTATTFIGHRPHSTVITIYNPVNLERFSPNRITRTQARRRLGLDPTGPVLGVIGQLAPWKAQSDAIRCLAELRSTWPQACLLVVGAPVFTSRATRYDNRAYAGSLRRLSSELNLNGSVRLLGEREDIPEILAALDLLLLPSWEEPFGRTVIEAMAMEVPVLATNVGGPAEIITDGVDGVLLAPRQPERWAAVVDALLRDASRRQEIGQRGRCTAVRRFGLESHTAAVLAVYRQLLGVNPN